MAISTFLKSAILGVTLVASSSLWAADCSEVIWNQSVLDRYPNISSLCKGVVERDGKQYVEIQAKFISVRDNKAHIKFKHADGSYGKTFETRELPSDFTVLIDGKDVPLRRVQRDTQLSLYLPPDRFVLLSDLAKEAEAIAFYQEVEPVMPTTGSSTPLLGLLGLLACGLGLLMTSLRRFRRC
jgi:hypothetical protein